MVSRRPSFLRRLGSVAAWASGDILEAIVRPIPSRIGPFPIGYKVRQWFWGKRCKAFGENVLIQENVNIYFPQNISIGSNVSITSNCILSAGVSEVSSLILGRDIFIGPGAMIFSCNHDYTQKNIKVAPKYICAPTNIGSNVWIGAMAGITAGVSVGSGSVVGMGAVVTKDVPDNTIVVGNPAKKIREIVRVEYAEEA